MNTKNWLNHFGPKIQIMVFSINSMFILNHPLTSIFLKKNAFYKSLKLQSILNELMFTEIHHTSMQRIF